LPGEGGDGLAYTLCRIPDGQNIKMAPDKIRNHLSVQAKSYLS
jgi:hypothetical protein